MPSDDAADAALELDPRVTLAVLRQLVELGSHGSLGAVARHLHLSQPTVSANLAKLEATVGFPLLSRGSGGSALTAEGRIIAAAAEEVLASSRELARTIRDLPHRRAERLRIAASLTIAEQLVPRWLADPRISRWVEPGQVALSVGNSEEVMAWTLDGAADIGFVEGNRFREGLSRTPVGRDELVAVVGPRHPWFRKRPVVQPAELVRAGLVLREHGSGTLEVIDDALRAAGVALPPDLPSFGSTSAILTAVRHGGALAIVSRLAVERDLDAGGLVAVEVEGVPFARSLNAVWSSAVAQRADATGLIAGIRAHGGLLQEPRA